MYVWFAKLWSYDFVQMFAYLVNRSRIDALRIDHNDSKQITTHVLLNYDVYFQVWD